MRDQCLRGPTHILNRINMPPLRVDQVVVHGRLPTRYLGTICRAYTYVSSVCIRRACLRRSARSRLGLFVASHPTALWGCRARNLHYCIVAMVYLRSAHYPVSPRYAWRKIRCHVAADLAVFLWRRLNIPAEAIKHSCGGDYTL